MSRVFSLNYRILLLAVLLMPLLLWLGCWQLQRAAEKETILASYESRQRQQPVLMTDVDPQADLAFQSVLLRGRYDTEHVFLLDNRIHQRQAGYDVLMPLQLPDDAWVIVNRGWIKAPARRSDLPEIPPVPETTVELLAEIYVPPGDGYQLSGLESSPGQWPQVIIVFDSETIGDQLQRQFFPYQLRLQDGQTGALVIDWPPINVSPEKHRAYALQWFALAAVLVLWLVVASLRKKP